MKLKTFILTFLMMSCSIVFGQTVYEVSSEALLRARLTRDCTIKITADFSIETTVDIPNGREITIDLNGHKLSTKDNSTYIFNNQGMLTIKDSDSEGKGTISACGIYNGKTFTRTAILDVNYDALLTIESGVFNNITSDGGAAIENYGVLDIFGGEFYGEYSAITNYGVATIENAYIECLNRDNGAAAIRNDFEMIFNEGVEIVGRYTKITETGIYTGEPTYLFAELNGVKYPSLQEALDACTIGDNTINLLFHNSDNATVSQKEGVNIIIDGNGYKDKQFEYTGTICVHGNSRHTGTETLTIQDINFITENDSHDFIKCDFRKCNEAAETVVRYAHNVTVQNCNFNAKDTSEEVVALRFRQSYNINVVGGKFTNLHSVMWATGTSGIAFDNIEATNCKEGGISVGTSTPVSVKNSTIAGAQYGVRADGSGNYSLNIEGGKLTAAAPVIVRNTTAAYNLTVNNNVELDATENGPQVVVTADSDNKPYVVPTSNVNVTLYDNVTSTFGLTAKIGNAFYATLQNAVDKAKTGETVTLIADNCKEDVTVTQAPNYAITIDGAEKTFKGTITVDGKSARYETTALTIKNVNFDATDGITYDACIRLGNGTDATRYVDNVTVEKCTFTDNDYTSVAVKSYTGGDWNLVVKDCEANGMHSLAQLANVEKGLVISGNTANTKNGINLNHTFAATIVDNIINVQGYAVRAGVKESNGGNITLKENTLMTNNTEGDPVIELRGTVVALNMEENVVSGNTHIKGTAGTISVDANYWDGKEAPVVPEGSAPIVVNSYYSDAALTNLVRNEMGSIYAFVSSDRIFGDVTTNAKESIKIEIIGKDGSLIGSSTLEKTEHATGFNNTLTWRINLGADDSGSWAMEWNEGAPSINNMPAKVKLYVDDADVAEAEIRYTADGDGKSPVFAAKTNAEGKINSFIACTGEYNLSNAANKLVSASADGDNIAILTAGTYNVPTGKNLTITGAVENVKFDMSKAVGINSSMTFNNVTFEYGNANYVGLQHAGTMVYNNCIINGQVFLYGTSETFNNCTFNQNSSGAYNVWTYGAKEVAFNECTFNSAGKSVLIYSDQPGQVNDVNVVNCQLNASNQVAGKAAFEMDSSIQKSANSITLNITETTATGFDKGNVSGNSLWNNKKGNNDDANNDITVVVDGETVLEPIYEAQIEDKKFRNLTDAFAAATEGQTITLLGDATPDLTSQRAITKAAVIELNGNTLTLKEDDLYFGTTTFKNGKIVVDPSVVVSTAVFWMFENQTLTFDNVNITATGVTGTYLIGINGGTDSAVNLLNNSSIIIDNESQAGLTAVICDNGTGNNVKIENSDIDVKNIEGRFYLGGTSGNITVDNTDIDLNGVKEGFYLRVNQTLSIGEHTTIDVVLNETEGRYGINFTDVNYTYTVDETATVNATVYEPVAIAQIGTIKYPTLQGAIDAVKDGETIKLLAECAEAVHINKTNVAFTIDGQISETEKVDFSGVIGINIGQNVTIRNIDFKGATANHDFIKNEGSPTGKNYNTTLLVENCRFTGNSAFDVVGVRTIHPTHTQIVNCTADGLHSLLQNTGGQKVTADNVVVINGKEGGLALGGVRVADVKNSKITANGYGVRIDAATLNAEFNIESSEFNAYIPVIARKATAQNVNFTFSGENTMTQTNDDDVWFVIENGNSGYHNGNVSLETLVAPTGIVNVTLNDTGLDRNGIYGNYGVAKINKAVYNTFADALNAVQDGETIEVLNVEGSEINKEIEFIKDIEFTITGTAPNYELPVITFQNATVNIKDAEILIPELDARQNATINVIDSEVDDAGGNSIAKSYYNGALNISGNSVVYMMQVTTMGYINISGSAQLHATWQTNVYGNGLVTIKDNATFNTAALHLTGQDYSNRDNTDADRVGKPAEIVVDGANFTVGNVQASNGADYSYNSSKGINVGTVEGKSAILNIMNGGNVNIYMANGETANIGAGGTVNVAASTLKTICRSAEGEVTLANNGTMNVTGTASINIKKLTGNAINFTDVTIADAYIGGRVNAFGTNNFSGETNVTGILSLGYETDPSEQVVVNITGNFNGSNVIVSSNNGVDNLLNVGTINGERTTAYFGQLGAFADVNIVNSDVTYHYAYVRNDFNVTNSTMEIKEGGVNTYFAGNAKVVIDNTTWNLPGYANIGSYGGYMYGKADVTLKNGSVMKGTNLGIEVSGENVVKVTLEGNSRLEATNLTNQGSIVLADVEAKVTSNKFDNAPTTTVAYHKVNYVDGSYVVVAKDYVAQIYDVNNNTNDDRRYETLQEALNAAQDGETIKLIADEIFTEDNRTCSSEPWYEGVYYVGDKNFTIDLNNYTVTQNGAVNDYMFLFKNAGAKDNTITLKNGTIDAGTDAYCAICTSTTSTKQITINTEKVNIINSNIDGSTIKIRGGAVLNVKEGTKITGKDSYLGIESSASTVNIYEGAEIYMNGTTSYNGCLVGVGGNGTINVYGGKGTGKSGGFIAMTSGGTINVYDGEWIANTDGTDANSNKSVLIAQSDKQYNAGAGNSIVNVSGGVFKGGYNCYGNAVGDAQINISGGIFSVDPSNYCAENYDAFPYDETSWVVRMVYGTQEFTLTAGWNWMSSYISEFDTDGLTWLKEDLSGQVGAQIKNNLHAVTKYEQGWFGSLTNVSVKEMYKVKATADITFTHEGSYVNYDECEIVLYPGWNYISYPVNEEMNLIDALAKLQPSPDDIIKRQDATATFAFGAWRSAFTLTPGQGYMYKNASDEIKSFYYTTKKTTSTDSDNRSSKYWTVDATQYPSNMTMIAMTDVEGGDYEVAAFVNGELRGSSRPVYVEELDAHILILTISGDEVAEVTFKYYDIATGEEVAFSNRINYSNDAIVGSMAEPYMLTRGTTGIGEASLSEINIYPNPTTTGTEINLQATCDKVEVFNALGVKVAEYQNVDTIDALETAGIYVIRITNDSNVQNCRLVVK